MEEIFNKSESDTNYEKKKYLDWIHGHTSTKDPTHLSCNLCGVNTDSLVLRVIKNRDFLVCKRHGGN